MCSVCDPRAVYEIKKPKHNISICFQATNSTDLGFFGPLIRYIVVVRNYHVTQCRCADGISIIDGEAPTTSAIVAEDVVGWHVLQIRGYSRIVKRICKGNFIESSTFSVGGHLWYIRYYPNGRVSDDAVDWTSIYLQHDATDDDEEVIARFAFGVLDDSGESVPMFSSPESKLENTFSSENRGWGHTKFVKRKDLEESSCLNDDCLKLW